MLVVFSMLAGAMAAPFSLMAIGDWGGERDLIPSNAAEKAAAAGMSIKSKQLGAQGVLLLGDNFYLEGVQSNESKRFQETFEDVYQPQMFNNGTLPFYVVAGNHDHRGNVQAQIEYHGSGRWHFPELYYSLPFSFTSSTGVARTVEILMIDTCSLAGVSDDDCQGCELPGPPSLEEAEAQWSWIEERLNTSTADFLWVGGHYPIYSAGQDGTTPVLVDRLLPLLKAHNAHYIGGHDHMHEHIVSEGVNMIVTGPGRECCYVPRKLHTVPKGAIKYMVTGRHGQGPGVGPKPTSDMLSGFSSLEFDDAVLMTLYKEDGTELYQAPPIAARSSIHRRNRPAAAKEMVEAAPSASAAALQARPNARPNATSSSSAEGGLRSKGLECKMCKELLPHVEHHECKSKCSDWWHWTQAACEDVCVHLLAVCVELGDKCEDLACSTAGYC